MSRLSVLLGIGFMSALCASRPTLAAPDRFDPEKHFPKECYFHVAGDLGTLRRAFRETSLGAVVVHPRMQKALGRLPRLVEQLLYTELDMDDFEREFGVPFFDFVAMFRGKVALTSPSIDLQQGPSLVMSFELTNHRAGISEFFMKAATAEGGGEAPVKSSHRGCEYHEWQVRRGGSMAHAIVGDSLLFGANGADLRAIIDRYKGEARGSLRSNPAIRALRERAAVGDGRPILTAYLNMRGFREKFYEAFESGPFGGPGPEAEVKAIFSALGIDALGGAMYQLALADGDWEGRLVLDSPKGSSGAIKIFGELFRAPISLGGLQKVPANASQIACGSARPGSAVRQIVELSTDVASKVGGQQYVDEFFKGLEKASGLSLKANLYTLPRIDWFSFTVTPPAGGLVPDSLVVCRREELQPYLNVLRKVQRRSGTAPRPLRVLGHEVTYHRVGKIVEMLGLASPGRPTRQPRDLADRLAQAFENPSLAVCSAKIDEEWAVVGFSPQAVGRYLEHHSKSIDVKSDKALLELVEGRIGRGSVFLVARGGRSVVAGYNTLVSLAQRSAPALGPVLERFGVDLAHLPAGEVFADHFRDGFVRVRATRTSLDIHGHRLVSNLVGSYGAPLLVATAAGLGSVFVENRMRRERLAHAQMRREAQLAAEGGSSGVSPPRPADLPRDQQRLLRVGQLFLTYMEKTKSRAYPHDPRGGVHVFQKLADAGVLDDPSVLVHPFSADRPARKNAAGKLIIDERTCSYHVVPWKQGPRDVKSRILCYEKQAFRGGGRNVIYVGLRTRFVKEAEFQSELKKQTARYGKKRERSE